jgi:hypothetical protein
VPELHPKVPELHPKVPELHPKVPELHPKVPELHPKAPGKRHVPWEIYKILYTEIITELREILYGYATRNSATF